MEKTLSSFVNAIQYTDEMKQLQKDFENLNKAYELLSQTEAILLDLFDLKPTCLNGELNMRFKKFIRLDSLKMRKDVETMQHIIAGECDIISAKVQELYNFQKLGNAISIYKNSKNEENNF